MGVIAAWLWAAALVTVSPAASVSAIVIDRGASGHAAGLQRLIENVEILRGHRVFFDVIKDIIVGPESSNQSQMPVFFHQLFFSLFFLWIALQK